MSLSPKAVQILLSRDKITTTPKAWRGVFFSNAPMRSLWLSSHVQRIGSAHCQWRVLASESCSPEKANPSANLNCRRRQHWSAKEETSKFSRKFAPAKSARPTEKVSFIRPNRKAKRLGPIQITRKIAKTTSVAATSSRHNLEWERRTHYDIGLLAQRLLWKRLNLWRRCRPDSSPAGRRRLREEGERSARRWVWRENLWKS